MVEFDIDKLVDADGNFDLIQLNVNDVVFVYHFYYYYYLILIFPFRFVYLILLLLFLRESKRKIEINDKDENRRDYVRNKYIIFFSLKKKYIKTKNDLN